MGKRGRPRKAGAKRINGRLSQRQGDVIARREETEREVTETARQARIRVFGVSEIDAMNPDTSTVVGRLKRAGAISEGQLKAAYRYEALVMAYRSAIAAPRQRCASDINGPTGSSNYPEDEERYRRIRSAYDAASKAVLDENAVQRSGNLLAALDTIVMRDVDLPQMHGDLRLALNALVHHFGIADEIDARAAA